MLPPRHTLELVTDKAGGCTSGLTGLPTFHTRGVKGAVRGVVCVCVCVCVCVKYVWSMIHHKDSHKKCVEVV